MNTEYGKTKRSFDFPSSYTLDDTVESLRPLSLSVTRLHAFTLMELLMAGAIFAVIGVIAVSIFISVAKANRRINLENEIYTEGYILMEKLVREVRKGTIDYEEYHSRLVVKWAVDSGNLVGSDTHYGVNYGEYAKKFYHPGWSDSSKSSIDSDFGQICADDPILRYDPNCSESIPTTCSSTCTPLTDSIDKNTYTNPYAGEHPDGSSPTSDYATAFCDGVHNQALDNNSDPLNADCATVDNQNTLESADFQLLHNREELYLINGNGDRKTIIAREVIDNDADNDGTANDNEYAVSIVRLTGSDLDQNDILETWECTENFICTEAWTDIQDISHDKPKPADLGTTTDSNNGSDFIPITPTSINVKSLNFFVSPLEDPHKATGEDDATMDYIFMQPYVTIILTVSPAYDEAIQVYGALDFPEITIETSVSTRVYNEIKSF